MLRIGRVFMVLIAVLALMDSVCVAESLVMTLQERLRQSDLVIAGEILKNYDTGVVKEEGVENRIAECKVTQIIKQQRECNFKDNQANSNIYISFIQISAKPSPLKLSAGKRYLLFLKESKNRNESCLYYDMITPYDGDFEVGKDYLIHDEQNLEFPKAVTLSFDAIVSRLTSDINKKPTETSPNMSKKPISTTSQGEIVNGLQLTIKAAKEVYEVGDEIWIEFKFKNVSQKPRELLIFIAELPLYHAFEFFNTAGKPIAYGGPVVSEELRRITKREEILAGGEYVTKVPLHRWKLAGLNRGYNFIGSETRKIFLKGIYFTPVGLKIADPDKKFFGEGLFPTPLP